MKDCTTNHCKINIHFQYSHKGNWEAQRTSLADSPRYLSKDKGCHRGRDHPNRNPG